MVEGDFFTKYLGKLHNGYTIKAASLRGILDIAIFTDSEGPVVYYFYFPSEEFSRCVDPLSLHSNPTMIKSANDLKNMLMDDLNRYNKT
jgi:hypothetical protein